MIQWRLPKKDKPLAARCWKRNYLTERTYRKWPLSSCILNICLSIIRGSSHELVVRIEKYLLCFICGPNSHVHNQSVREFFLCFFLSVLLSVRVCTSVHFPIGLLPPAHEIFRERKIICPRQWESSVELQTSRVTGVNLPTRGPFTDMDRNHLSALCCLTPHRVALGWSYGSKKYPELEMNRLSLCMVKCFFTMHRI